MLAIEIGLFLFAIFCAWYLGVQANQGQSEAQSRSLPRDYLVGLNLLLNEETDKAVDIFIKMLEVDSDTVETHLAVGKLFRKRGEVDRAIRIHQNLIARPQLEQNFRDQSMLELGRDYMTAGMLDRAERIFLELVNSKSYVVPALRSLLDIYQQEKAWKQAIDTARKLQDVTSQPILPIVAHYHCELAESAFGNNQLDLADQYLKEALYADKNSVRASLLQGKFDIHRGEYKSALKYLKKIKDQNPEFLSEAIEPITQCYERLGENKKLISYLKEILDEHPRVPVVLILADRIRQWKGDKVAANFVADYVRRYPSLRGLDLFINIYSSSVEGRAKEDLLILQNLIKRLLGDKPDYQCVSCGFPGKSLHWHCPGCKNWNSIKPVFVFE